MRRRSGKQLEGESEMGRRRLGWLRLVLVLCITCTVVVTAPGGALGYGGGGHSYSGEDAGRLFKSISSDPVNIARDRDIPLYPEFARDDGFTWWDPNTYDLGDRSESDHDSGEGSETRTLRDWMAICSMKTDDIEDTRHHFWDADDNLDECPEGWAGLDNAWETVQPYYLEALEKWNAGDLVGAYALLGYATHFIVDMGQPAHTNSDMHGPSNRDSLENWFGYEFAVVYASNSYSWDPNDAIPQPPGPPLFVTKTNAEILADMYAATEWPGREDIADYPDLADPSLPTNLQQLFYLMYTVNQNANWFSSDGEDGNSFEPIGWLGGYPGYPGSPTTESDFDDNDEAATPCEHIGQLGSTCNEEGCNFDGDLSTVVSWAYSYAFRAVPASIDLFRRTVDAVPPVTTFTKARSDGKDVVYWNNVPVTITLIGATDGANPGFRPSDVWKRWAKATETWQPQSHDVFPVEPQDAAPYLVLDTEGIFDVQLLSTDWCGNVEGPANDFELGIDMTPPEISFPDLQPNYLTSQTFVPLWDAVDALSGVEQEVAYLDGNIVQEGTPIDLALMAGTHQLSVYAKDRAQNWAHKTYEFEVWIDTVTDVKPMQVNTKTEGEGMMVSIEFPEPYDVGAVDVTTCRLRVGATIDLHEQDPVMGGTATLVGEVMTGAADRDKDGLPEVSIRFDKGAFAAEVPGQTGDIPAVVWGGLLPDGTPRFIGPVTVPVFTPPVK